MQRLFPPPSAPLAIEAVYRELVWPPPPAERPFVALNMVTTVDGVAAIDGSAQGIGSRVDRQLMRQIRAHADAVLIGGGTLRAENVDPSVPRELEAQRQEQGLSRQPLAIVLSASAELPLERTFFRSDRFERVVLTSRRADPRRLDALRPLARIVVLDADHPTLTSALALLRHELGVRWLLSEGGPSVNASLLAEGLLDELFWTVAPRLTGLGGPTMIAAHPPAAPAAARLDLLSALLHDDELFLRYRVLPPEIIGA